MITRFFDSVSDRKRDKANARSELLRRAETQGVGPFTSLDDFAGDAEITSNVDVDEFLHQVRKDRDRPRTSS